MDIEYQLYIQNLLVLIANRFLDFARNDLAGSHFEESLESGKVLKLEKSIFKNGLNFSKFKHSQFDKKKHTVNSNCMFLNK